MAKPAETLKLLEELKFEPKRAKTKTLFLNEKESKVECQVKRILIH